MNHQCCEIKPRQENKNFKNKSQKHYHLFNKWKNFCSKLYKKEREKYYYTFDIRNVTDNQQFPKTTKPFLSEKSKTSLKIMLKNKNKFISNDNKPVEEFSSFLENAGEIS